MLKYTRNEEPRHETSVIGRCHRLDNEQGHLRQHTDISKTKKRYNEVQGNSNN